MKKNTRCRAKLKSGMPCSYRALQGRRVCGHHIKRVASRPKKGRRESRKVTVQNIAHIVGTAWQLVQLLDKAVTYYPALIKLLDSFMHFTAVRWSHRDFLSDLRLLREKRPENIKELIETGRAKTEIDHVNLKLLIHHIA